MRRYNLNKFTFNITEVTSYHQRNIRHLLIIFLTNSQFREIALRHHVLKYKNLFGGLSLLTTLFAALIPGFSLDNACQLDQNWNKWIFFVITYSLNEVSAPIYCSINFNFLVIRYKFLQRLSIHVNSASSSSNIGYFTADIFVFIQAQ